MGMGDRTQRSQRECIGFYFISPHSESIDALQDDCCRRSMVLLQSTLFAV